LNNNIIENITQNEGQKNKTKNLAHQKQQAEKTNPDHYFFIGSYKLIQIHHQKVPSTRDL